MTLFSTIFEAKPVVLRLYYQDQSRVFWLDAFYKDKPIAIGQSLAKIGCRSVPANLSHTTASQLRLKPSQFLAVRDWLIQLSAQIDERKAICAVDGIANRLQKVLVPGWFSLTFIQNAVSLACRLPDTVIPLDETGWFLCGEEMWQCGLNEDEEAFILRPIAGMELVRFLRETLPDWTSRGIAFECPLSFDAESCVKIVLQSIDPQRVAIARRVDFENAQPLPGAEGFVLTGREVRPSLADELVQKLFAEGDSCVLQGDAIAEFVLAVKGPWASAVEGDRALLESLHTVFTKADLFLLGYHTSKSGVGQALARPMLEIGGQFYDAAQVSSSIAAHAAYARIASGFVPVLLLYELGIGRMGRLLDGTSLDKTYKLKFEELLWVGSNRLNGPWSRMLIPDLHWAKPADPTEQPLVQHFNFLMQWGFNGGILGGALGNTSQIAAFLARAMEREPKSRLLVVGKRSLLDALAQTFAPLNPLRLEGGKNQPMPQSPFSGLMLIPANTLLKCEMLHDLSFDVLLLLEPDDMTKTDTSQTYQQLYRIKAQLRLAVYSTGEFMSQTKTQWVQRALLGVANDIVARYAILDPQKPKPALPVPYTFPALSERKNDAFASVEISSAAPVRSIPIPPRLPRTEPTLRASADRSVFESGEQRFAKAARANAEKNEHAASFVPFQSYWPTYESMTAAQLRWYFYWRAQARQQNFLPTDLSYIFLHLYELLNLVGCESPRQGYDQIMALWKAYRETFPRLNLYLGNWMIDFVLVHKLDSLLQEVLTLCGTDLTGELLDMELYRRFCSEPIDIDLKLLAHAADYDITRSKFYQSTHSLLADVTIPKVIALVDGYLKKQQGLRIVEMFYPGQVVRVRYLFRGAVYAGDQRELKVTVVPLSTHAPLREFLAQIVRCAENKLREITGFSGKLRGIELETELQKLIGLYLERELSAKESEPIEKKKFTIDQEKLARAAQEAEEIKRMLTLETGIEPEAQTALGVSESSNARPDLQDDLSAWSALFDQLSPEGKSLLDVLKDENWEASDEVLRQRLPELLLELTVHSVNETALSELGSLLIVQEGNRKLVDEDYRDELRRMYSEPIKAKAHAVWNASLIEESWRSLFEQLTPWQTDMLHAAVSTDDVNDEWLRIAGRAGDMVELLLEGINEAAMETIGDLLIENGTVLPEYQEVLQTIFR